MRWPLGPAVIGLRRRLSPCRAGRADVVTAESYPFPASGALVVDGHGWGHGAGMSQQGAKQGALDGVPATGILSFYYPGATFAGAGSPPIRVALTGAVDSSSATGYQPPSANRYQCSDLSAGATSCTLTVVQTTGLVVTDTATGAHPDAVTGADEWGVASNKDGLHLRAHTPAGWGDAHVAGKPAVLAGPITFNGPTFVRVDWGGQVLRDYRTQVSAVRTDPGSATTPSRMLRLATMPLDDYIRGVVYQESPSYLAAAGARGPGHRGPLVRRQPEPGGRPAVRPLRHDQLPGLRRVAGAGQGRRDLARAGGGQGGDRPVP